MKKLNFILCIIIIICCLACNIESYVSRKTDNLIEKCYKQSDTVYLSNVNDIYLIWYHKGGYIYSFLIKPLKSHKYAGRKIFGFKPYKTAKYHPVKAENIFVTEEEIKKCFDQNNILSKKK